MSHAVRVLCRPEVAAGFALAGLGAIEAATPDDAALRLGTLLGQADTGVVLVEDALYDGLPDELRRQVARRALPMVVPFPGPAWAAEPEAAAAYVVELLRQVIGYRVRLA